MVRKLFFGAVACLALAACAGTPKLGGSPNLAVVQQAELPAPSRADHFDVMRDFTLGPRDRISIEVFGAPDLTRKEIEIDNAGRVSFPFVGEVSALGRTPGEFAADLESRLRQKYFRDPQVTVNVLQQNSQVVTVEGELKEPGIYPVINDMTLMGAIASAKGTTENSALDDVVIFRTVDDKRYAALYSLKAIRDGLYDDPDVYPNDVVMVGTARGRLLFKDILTVLPVLTTPLILLLRKN